MKGKLRLVASQRRAMAIFLSGAAFLLGIMVITTILRPLQGPLENYSFVVGALIGGTIGMWMALGLMKTEVVT